jgi:hypothetical protein
VSAWTQQPVPQEMIEQWAANLPGQAAPRLFTRGELRAMLGREPCGGAPEDPPRWHLSISHPDRVPSWEEVRDACHELRPGVTFSIGIPPRSMWLNEHDHVLHAWETVDEALFAEYRTNARGDTPT